jgi:hypothetical protein
MSDKPPNFDSNSVAEPMSRHWRALKDELSDTHGEHWREATAVALGAMLGTLLAVAEKPGEKQGVSEVLIELVNEGLAASGGSWRLVKVQ